MVEPGAKFKKHLRKNLPDNDSIVSSDDEPQNKSSLFSDLRGTVTKGAQMWKSQVSRQKGMMVRVIKKQFPMRKDRDRSNSNLSENKFPTDVSPPLFPQLQDSWLKVRNEDVAKDIHRLIFRVTVKTSGQKDILLEPPPKEERGGNRYAALAVVNLVKLLGKRMLDDDESLLVRDLCDEMIESVHEKTDLIEFNLELFDKIGENSKVMKVLRCIHQSLVLKPYGILRTVMIKDKITKDVRSDDGWQICITVAEEGFVQVVHVRKEQSVDFPTKNQPDSSQNHWEYQWEVSMTFDKNMRDMTQSRLSITNLVLSEGMDPDLEKELREIMQNGNLVVF